MSQRDQIFSHLKRHGSITPLVALNRYGCMRLAARICEFREAGYRIETEIQNGKSFARYRYHSQATKS